MVHDEEQVLCAVLPQLHRLKQVRAFCSRISQSREKGWSLTPGAYVGVAPVEDDGVDFHARMKEIHEELRRLQAQSNDLMATISQNLEELGI